MPTVPAELAPAVFLPEPLRAAYFRAGARAVGEGKSRAEAIRAGLLAAQEKERRAERIEPTTTAPRTLAHERNKKGKP